MKRALSILLIIVILTVSLNIAYQETTNAIAGVDDIGIAILILSTVLSAATLSAGAPQIDFTNYSPTQRISQGYNMAKALYDALLISGGMSLKALWNSVDDYKMRSEGLQSKADDITANISNLTDYNILPANMLQSVFNYLGTIEFYTITYNSQYDTYHFIFSDVRNNDTGTLGQDKVFRRTFDGVSNWLYAYKNIAHIVYTPSTGYSYYEYTANSSTPEALRVSSSSNALFWLTSNIKTSSQHIANNNSVGTWAANDGTNHFAEAEAQYIANGDAVVTGDVDLKNLLADGTLQQALADLNVGIQSIPDKIRVAYTTINKDTGVQDHDIDTIGEKVFGDVANQSVSQHPLATDYDLTTSVSAGLTFSENLLNNIFLKLGTMYNTIAGSITTGLNTLSTTLTNAITTAISDTATESVALENGIKNYNIPDFFLLLLGILLAVIALMLKILLFLATLMAIPADGSLLHPTAIATINLMKNTVIPHVNLSFWVMFQTVITILLSLKIVKFARSYVAGIHGNIDKNYETADLINMEGFNVFK